MGKGDKKTKKGKISMGSYGVLRPKAKNKLAPAKLKKSSTATAKKATEKKATATKTAKKAPAKKKE